MNTTQLYSKLQVLKSVTIIDNVKSEFNDLNDLISLNTKNNSERRWTVVSVSLYYKNIFLIKTK